MLWEKLRTWGRGAKLERFKFTVYLLAPVLAVYMYSMPSVHETALTSRRYIVYTNPKVPVFRKKKHEDAESEDAAAGEQEEQAGHAASGAGAEAASGSGSGSGSGSASGSAAAPMR